MSLVSPIKLRIQGAKKGEKAAVWMIAGGGLAEIARSLNEHRPGIFSVVRHRHVFFSRSKHAKNMFLHDKSPMIYIDYI